jgi:hypothetical protein
MTNPVEIADELAKDLAAEIKLSNDPYLKVDFFKEVIKWASIKSKIDPDAGEGSKINEYRSVLKESGGIGGNTGTRTRSRKEGRPAAPRPRTGPFAGLGFDPSPPRGSFPVPNGTDNPVDNDPERPPDT